MLSKKYIYNSMKLTIDKFQRLQAIATLDTEEIEKASRLVQVLLDKSEAEVESMPLSKFSKLCDKLKVAFDLTIDAATMSKPKTMIVANGNVYNLNFDIKPPFNTGRYIEVLTFSKDDPIMNMHNILASICTPMKWSWKKFNYVKQPYDTLKHEEYANDFKQADFRHGYFAMVFFYTLLTNSTNVTMDSLIVQMKLRKVNKKRVLHLKKVLQTISVGSTTQNK
jgi:hypothetical protein